MTDNVRKTQPEKSRATVTTYDPIISDLDDTDIPIEQYSFSKTSFQLCLLDIYTQKCPIFSNLDEDERNILCHAMNSKSYEANEFVFRKGDIANIFYIIKYGDFKLFDGDQNFYREYYKGDLICASAMLFPYNQKFNFMAINHGSVWFIERQIFRRIKMTLTTRRRKICETYLAAIPLFRPLHSSDFLNLADCLETCTFKKGEFIYKQQSISNGLYIIEKGIVHMCTLDDVGKQVILTVIKKGGHFGERSMITCSPRKTSAIAGSNVVVVSFLRVSAFERLKGFCKDIALEEDINDIFGSGVNIFFRREL